MDRPGPAAVDRTDAPGGVDAARQLALLGAQAEASPDGLLVVGAEGRVLATNRRFGALWGFSDPLLALADDEVALDAAAQRVADPDAFLASVRAAYADVEVPTHDEVALLDGRVLERHGAPLHDLDGAYLGWAWWFRDVTAQRRAERQLRELARTLQATLLPPRPPEITGLQVAARYRASTGPLVVGGDFYDVFRLRSNDWGVVVGDVCGKGAAAAAMTALARYSVRAGAVHHDSPAAVLHDVNDALLDEPTLGERFCSAVLGRVRLDVCGAWVDLAVAGHPAPLVVRRLGWVDVRGNPGDLLGLFEAVHVADDRVGLGPGDALVLCTDGITEARAADGTEFGDERLGDLLAALAGASADTMADAVLDEATAFAPGGLTDDAAVLVLRVPEDPAAVLVDRVRRLTGTPPHADPPRPAGIGSGTVPGDIARPPAPPRHARMPLADDAFAPALARRFVDQVLHSWRMPAALRDGEVELLVTELVTNAVRHAGTAVAVDVRYDGRRVRVEVADGSTALPERRTVALEATGGRGVRIVEDLADDWGVQPRPGGKAVWFAIDF